MNAKKSPKSNLENKRITFVLIGFVVVLAFVYILLEWGKKDPPVPVPEITVITDGEITEILLPQTFQNQPKGEATKTATIPIEIEITNNNDGTGEEQPEIEGGEDDPGEGVGGVSGIIPPPPVIKPDDVDSIFIFPGVPPEPGVELNAYISKAIRYPVIAMEHGIQGRVVVQFVIEKDGSISNVRVAKGVDPSLDKEAVRVVTAMPKWKPGRQNGRPVRVAFTMPIMFKLKTN